MYIYTCTTYVAYMRREWMSADVMSQRCMYLLLIDCINPGSQDFTDQIQNALGSRVIAIVNIISQVHKRGWMGKLSLRRENVALQKKFTLCTKYIYIYK